MGDIPGRPPDYLPRQSKVSSDSSLFVSSAVSSSVAASVSSTIPAPSLQFCQTLVPSEAETQPIRVSNLDPLAQHFIPVAVNANLGCVSVEPVVEDEDVLVTWMSGKEVSSPASQLRKAEKHEDLLPLLPFMDDPELSAFPTPAKPALKSSNLPTVEVKIPGAIFIDKVLPSPSSVLVPHPSFSPSYFVDLGNSVTASGFDGAGFCYPAGTPNFLGVRIPLRHTNLKIGRWRHLLIGYEDAHICQHLEYGFPLGQQVCDRRSHESCLNWSFSRGSMDRLGVCSSDDCCQET